MKVGFTELPGPPVEKMEVIESGDFEIGTCVGYRCQKCGEADETLAQLYHKADCPLAGMHGREFYGEDADLASSSDGRLSAELDPDNPLWLVVSGETDRADDVYNGEVVAIRCRCGAADDDVFSIVHGSRCPLADEHCEHGTTDVEDLHGVDEAMADGGLR